MRENTENYVVDARGRKRAVIVPLARYRRLLEDLHDLAVVAERRKEPTISFEALKRRLKKRGRL
jgi:PHD/YefM family antitoxin component YafN of YafNO toxin-antitoxin module